MNTKLLHAIVLSLCVTTLTACSVNDFNDIHIKPSVTLPFGTAVISDQNIFSWVDIEDQLDKDDQGVLCFLSGGNYNAINESTTQEILNLNFNPYHFSFSLPQPPIPLPYYDIPPGVEQWYNMSSDDGTVIDQLIVKRAKIEFEIKNPDGKDYSRVVCTIPQITRDGVPVQVRPGQTLSLDDTCVFNFDQEGEVSNRLVLVFSGQIPYTTKLMGVVRITDAQTKYAEGFFGSKEVASNTVEVSTGIGSLNEFTSYAKYVYFRNPSINLQIGNQLNIPMMFNIKTLEIDGQAVPLKNTLGNAKFYAAPGVVSNVSINNGSTTTGTALSDVITKGFEKIKLTLTASINPSADELGQDIPVSTKNSFHSTDTLGVIYNVKLPFDCILEGVKFVQEIDIDMADLKDPNNIYEKMAIRMTGRNQLPMTLDLKPYVTNNNDKDGVKTYLLNSPITIGATPSNLNPKNPGFQPFEITDANPIITQVLSDKIDKLLNSTKLFLELSASTRDAQNHTPENCVKLFSPTDLKLNIMLGIEGDVNITPSNKK